MEGTQLHAMVCHTNSSRFINVTFPDFECIIGGELPKVIIQKGMQRNINCVNDRFVSTPGWKLVRDNATGAVIDLVGKYYVLLSSDQFPYFRYRWMYWTSRCVLFCSRCCYLQGRQLHQSNHSIPIYLVQLFSTLVYQFTWKLLMWKSVHCLQFIR